MSIDTTPPDLPLVIRQLNQQDYLATWEAMKAFCIDRTGETHDEIWFVEHPSVFTQGVSGKPEHVLSASDIPIIQTDRGGQVTYHGPGQLVMYVLLDLRRLGIGVRALVDVLENITISGLKKYGLKAAAQIDAPGVYLNDKKIASLGLRVKKGCSYHGLSINVDMDLTPFSFINPCGYKGLEVTQLSKHGVKCTTADFSAVLLHELKEQLNYSQLILGPNTLHV
ncbi:MAG: lipoyl(octanoyl) transferase [Cycloclasticus pugetii]|uniref:Octanoyltransferase n=2 Tax=Cycloclasticus TaxID=34067 RepID=S5TDZ2_9GAMM|nr:MULTISPECIES: lipoyl(octanoyl) transferase LipB [Cycloclasticus]ATI02670.1 lipoyl(octanoyl) transferase LipB [Cycloclasticus sp. PY97N]AGS39042.1 Lipoate-protein ligase B [Cycloclasticus zancles 78-ME]EPD12847.1 lipoate-protein ligase B [Cycloclasticus pugetii]MBV1899046.1 lipoyl(octanoyl) transferase LipB [Cycloclasticus sp.]MDF1829954.1 lipoyl(octanoyl) transferase LipB [Cycloclasticus pugetii]